MRHELYPALLVGLLALTACGKSDNGTGTHSEDGREIAKTGSFQGRETHGQVGTVEQVEATKSENDTNSVAP